MLLAGALLLAAGCSRPDHTGIRLAVANAPVTLDPRYAADAVSQRVVRLLYRSLTDFDAHYRVVPALADWEPRGPLRYRFHLRATGRRFHDGTRLSAADVAATYRSILAPDSASPQRAALAVVTAIEIVDADTLEFVLARPEPLLPGLLGIGILPAPLLERGHDFARAPIGSGPLRFVAWPQENRLLLERVADRLPVEILTVRDPTVRALKIVRGEVDLLAGDLPPEIFRWLGGRTHIATERAAGATFSYLGFNLDDPVAGRHAVRQAVAQAIDRAAIVTHVYGGTARLASGLLPPEHWAGHPGLAAPAYDPAAARALLAAAGFGPQHRPRLTYKTSNNPFRLRIAQIIRADLAAVGVDVTIDSRDWGTFYADVQAGRFQMFGLSWVALQMPDIFRYALHSQALPPAGANRGHYASARADALIERAEEAGTLAGRVPLYRELAEVLVEELPYVPLWYEDQLLARRADVTGYRVDPDGSYDGLMYARRSRP